jgi:N-acetylmuramoyl-L-alanine amidase
MRPRSRTVSVSRALRAAAALLALGLYACAPLPPAPWIAPAVPAEARASPNFDQRRPNFVVLHHTSNNTAEEALSTLTNRARGVSSHYLIDRSGRLYYLVDERQRAWHAGASYWAGQRDLNSSSIGIELDNNGQEPFAEPQIVTLLALLGDLKTRYKLPAPAFLGHSDVAPGRKVDPSALFPWKRLAEHGFGLWCDPPYPAVPLGLDAALLLQAFGYNVWNLDAAIAAFKRRFVPDDPTPQMTEKVLSVLYCVVLQQQTLAAQEQEISPSIAAPAPRRPPAAAQ